ncbi:DUF1214 domain-containing protein [Nocardia jiangsuensis]|uniref:DUF1214 domain-containing protein n=1 Tax=Nocardia jiangsuensis TaxID=1691563 RepID=A0ABV8DZB5_9NOCA
MLRAIRVYPLNVPDRVLRYVDTTAEAMDSTCLRWEGNLEYWLDRTASYTLDLPRPVPGKLLWSVTVYDAATRSRVQAPSDVAALRSLFELRDLPDDGPVRLHFGPTPPPDAENRWLQTVPGRGWFAYLRIYGPEQAAFGETWRPGDFIRTR